MSAIESLNLQLEPEPSPHERLRQYELGHYTPATPDELLVLIHTGRTMLRLVTTEVY